MPRGLGNQYYGSCMQPHHVFFACRYRWDAFLPITTKKKREGHDYLWSLRQVLSDRCQIVF